MSVADFDMYPSEHLTEQQATILAKGANDFRSLEFARIEKTSDGYVVWMAYMGGKMIYTEPSGRIHHLRGGMLKIGGFAEWEGIRSTLIKGVSAEFL